MVYVVAAVLMVIGVSLFVASPLVGGTPLVFPAIVILPPEDAAPLARVHAALAEYDYAVFVSANAVEYGVPDRSRWPDTLVALAPGPGTAQALADVGIANVRVPTTSLDSEGLLALPEFSDVQGRRVALLTAGLPCTTAVSVWMALASSPKVICLMAEGAAAPKAANGVRRGCPSATSARANSSTASSCSASRWINFACPARSWASAASTARCASV
jgi:hypothetical protein